eukprot:COSAG01_NODE_65235_length_274_cov_0.508571_2_plen_20_part_01
MDGCAVFGLMECSDGATIIC